MRIAFLTAGRFHLVDLARELVHLGHEARVYSLVPAHVTQRYGLPSECNRWLGQYVAPAYLATKLARGVRARSLADHALLSALDAAACRHIEPCDILVAMSGIGLRSLDVIKQKYSARIFLERSSRHILSQRAILEAMPISPSSIPEWTVVRELAGYGFADVITVPAQHVVDSFVERGVATTKLFRNPLGVSLDAFQPTPAPREHREKTILMTGAWCMRKGCDVLVDAWRRLPGTRLLHVGAVVDAPLPRDPLFRHVDAVRQDELPRFYAQGDVFALASREEGLAVVQAQALASGLPLVCTSRSGGEDLAALAAPNAVTVVPPDDAAALAAALSAAMQRAAPPGQMRDQLGDRREALSWRASALRYADRMAQELKDSGT